MKTKIPPPLVALAFALGMWGLAIQLSIGHVIVPGRGMVAILLLALGLGIMVSAIRDFRKAGTTVNPLDPSQASTLVNEGIFSRSRNPMYLGMLIILMAWSVWLGNVFNIGSLILFVWFITTFQIKPEEEALVRIFGEPYETYRNTVRRWL